MAAPLRDLVPRGDVKGGSPRTPSGGIPKAEYQQYVENENGNGFWKAVACGIASASFGIIVGLFLAWYTAMQGKGISMKELQEYEDKYSPYMQQRDTLAMHNQTQDTQIGALQGIQQRNIERLSAHETKLHDDERDIVDLQGKVKRFADYIEEQQKAKK